MTVIWLIGGAASPATTSTIGTPDRSPASSPAAAAATASPSSTAVHVSSEGTAADALRGLTVRTSDTPDTVDASDFGSWADTDGNGCDTLNDLLRRDLTDVTITPGTNGCVVLSGTLTDPYSGAVSAFASSASTTAQLDRVVTLTDAWKSGASDWSATRRAAFANDPLNLLVVGAGADITAKAAADATDWLPSNEAFHCEYVARHIAVKSKYDLSVKRAEAVHLDTTLQQCARQALPVSVLIPLAAEPAPTQAPTAPQPVVGQAAKPTTTAPKPTTTAPQPTSSAPKPATSAPKPATSAPRPTTAAPKATTSAPKPTTKAPEPTSGCSIKGNISSSGEKIYHVPGGQSYDKTKIDPKKGERFFCSEADAVKAGWRKSKR